ncbi:MAG: 30S ribosome-binding factor RbfA [Candidatus Omnitrophica bacterium]|nr:30S ribosome-binding factor RbfA [Candidatus Omnitrophota bacterium]MCK5287840.1 30S ribosome-binding factor RbfA [Candidatus Omnitrophota bacterium]MCK5493641.1 30S ribosome-binding factor RbfA [Candidatus Omnitrophota bacterium]
MSLRMERINSELRKKIMEIFLREVDDPDISLLSITKVITTNDLQESKVYFSVLDENKYEKVQRSLNLMKGFIQGTLGKKIRLKKTPHLIFIKDDSMKYSVDIFKKIEDVKNSGQWDSGETIKESE